MCCSMSDTPIYDQLRAELSHVDLPAGDDHPPDAVTAQPVAQPRHSHRRDVNPVDDVLPE